MHLSLLQTLAGGENPAALLSPETIQEAQATKSLPWRGASRLHQGLGRGAAWAKEKCTTSLSAADFSGRCPKNTQGWDGPATAQLGVSWDVSKNQHRAKGPLPLTPEVT